MKRNFLILLLIGAVIFSPVNSSGAKAKKAFAENGSTFTTCAEEDNINVCLTAKSVRQFQVIARHPAYDIGLDICAADFSGCGVAVAEETARADDPCETILDDGTNVVQICQEQDWWRQHDMMVRVGNASAPGHRLVISKKVEGEASWPQFLVIYEDGNMRLKPHPSPGRADVCFGSSVIIGPVAPSSRPFVDIQEITVDPVTACLNIAYRDGGTARVCLSVDRVQAVADVQIAYNISQCFAVFRSMWVEDGNSDVDHIQVKGRDLPILGDWERLKGSSWLFHRVTRSRHNTSAPDILVKAMK